MEEEEIKGILEEYVVTANSGKYKSWEEINEKFPELSNYDKGVLEEYVVTANSGKYKSWEEINSKFPEIFNSSGGAETNFTEGSQEPQEQPSQPSRESLSPEDDYAQNFADQNTFRNFNELQKQSKKARVDLGSYESMANNPDLIGKRGYDEIVVGVETNKQKATDISKDIKKQQQYIDKIINDEIEVDATFIQQGATKQGLNRNKIYETAEAFVAERGLTKDDPAYEYVVSKLEEKASYQLVKPFVEAEFKSLVAQDEKFKEVENKTTELKSMLSGINAKYEVEAKQATKPLREEYEQGVAVLGGQINKELELTLAPDVEELATKYKQAVESGALPLEDAQKQLQTDIEALYKEGYESAAKLHESDANKLYEDFLGNVAQVNNRINQSARREQEKSIAEFEKYVISLNLDEKQEELFKQAYVNASEKVSQLNISREASMPMLYNMTANTISSLFDGIAGLATSMGATGLKESATALVETIRTEPESLEEISDLFDRRKFEKSFGNLLGRMTPALAAGFATGGVASILGASSMGGMIAGSAGAFLTESADMAGTIENDVFAETGDAGIAKAAQSEMWRGQLMIMPLYTFEMLPFSKLGANVFKGSSKLGKITRVPKAAATEFLTELPQEFTQGSMEEAIKKSAIETGTPSISGATEFMTLERLGETALEIAPVMLLGGGGQAVSQTREEISKRKGVAIAQKENFATLVPEAQEQFLFDVVTDNSVNTAKGVLAFAGINGLIDEQTLSDLSAKVEEMEGTKSLLARMGIKGKDAKIAYPLYQELEGKMQELQDAKGTPLEAALKQEVKALQENFDNFLLGSDANYMVVTFADGTSRAVTFKNAEEFLIQNKDAIINGDMSVDIRGTKLIEVATPILETPTESQVTPSQTATESQTLQEEEGVGQVLENKSKFNEVSGLAGKRQPINENNLQEGIDEAYTALEELEGNTSEDANIMRELIEDEIQKLENYDNTTTTETRKIAEERTRTVSKKTPRKTIPRKEKEFVGKKAKFRDNKGGGGQGVITVVETPDGKEYYVLQSEAPKEVVGARTKGGEVIRKVAKIESLEEKTILGETDKVFEQGQVNIDKGGNAVSVTFPMSDGKQITIENPEIAEQVIQEQTIQQEFDEQIFEETYIEFVGEEQVEVKKPKTETTSKQEQSGVKQNQSKPKTAKTVSVEEQEAIAKEIGNVRKAKPEDKLKAAFDKWKEFQTNVGAAYNPKSSAKADVEFTKALVEYLVEKFEQGTYSATKFVEDMSNTVGGNIKNIKSIYRDLRPQAQLEVLKNKAKKEKNYRKVLTDWVNKEMKEMEISELTRPEVMSVIRGERDINAKNFEEIIEKVFDKLSQIGSKKRLAEIKKKQKKIRTSTKTANRFGLKTPIYRTLAFLDTANMTPSQLDKVEELIDAIYDKELNQTFVAEDVLDFLEKIEKPEPKETEDKEKKGEEKRRSEAIEEVKKLKLDIPQETLESLNADEKVIVQGMKALEEGDLKFMPTELIERIPNIFNNATRGIINTASQKLSEAIKSAKASQLIVTASEKIGKSTKAKRAYRGFKIKQLGNIDSMLGISGDLLRRVIYPVAKAYEMYQTEMDYRRAKIMKHLKKMSIKEKQIATSKIAIYMYARMYESNRGAKGVHSVKDLIEVTFDGKLKNKDYKDRFGDTLTQYPQELYEKYKDENGNISAEVVLKDFTTKEKALLKALDIVKEGDDATVYKLAYLDRGMASPIYDNHISYFTLRSEDITAEMLKELSKGNMSVMAGVLYEREAKANPVRFDAVNAVLQSSDQLMMDKYLGETLRVESGAFRYALKYLDKNGTQDQVDIIKLLADERARVREVVLANEKDQTSKLMKAAVGAVYSYLLGTIKKFVTEYTSNQAGVFFRDVTRFKLATPRAYKLAASSLTDGEYHKGFMNLLSNLGSIEYRRLMGNKTMGRYDDAIKLVEDRGALDTRTPSRSARVANAIKWLGKPQREVAKIAITASDNLFARGIFIDEMQREFKRLTGQKLDFEKLASNDKAYFERFKDVLEEARFKADEQVTDFFNNTNPMDRSFGRSKEEQGKNAYYGVVNNFMLSFQLQEAAYVNKQFINKGIAGGTAAALSVIARMVTYQVVADLFFRTAVSALLNLIGDDEDKELKTAFIDVLNSTVESKAIERGVLASLLELTVLSRVKGVGRMLLIPALNIAHRYYGHYLGTREEDLKDKLDQDDLYFSKFNISADRKFGDVSKTTVSTVGGVIPVLTPATDFASSLLDLAYVYNKTDEDSTPLERFNEMTAEQKGRMALTKTLLQAGASSLLIPKDFVSIYKGTGYADKLFEKADPFSYDEMFKPQ